MQINSGVRKDQKKTLEPLRMKFFHFSGRSSFLKDADTFMCNSIAMSGRIKAGPRTTSNGKFSFFWKKFVFEGGRYFSCANQ